MKLINNGLHSSMEYNAATMIASTHLGRSLVLNHCTEKKEANWKEQFLQSKYNDPHLFGVLPNSARAKFTNHMTTYGQVMVRDGDIPAQVQDVIRKPKFIAALISTGGQTRYFSQKKAKPGLLFRAGVGESTKTQASEAVCPLLQR